jgi:hypothetical protein
VYGVAVPEIAIDRHQGLTAQYTGLFKTVIAHGGSGRLQADSGAARRRQINLDDV